MSDKNLEQLCEALVDGTLSDQDRLVLESMVLNHPDSRRFYLEWIRFHANLMYADESDIPPLPPDIRAECFNDRFPADPSDLFSRIECRRDKRSILYTKYFPQKKHRSRYEKFVTLVTNSCCTWRSTDIPTSSGTRLGQNQMELVSGIASLNFDRDTRLHLEGPCQIDIESEDRCILHYGRVVAEVGPSGSGFILLTPRSVIRDWEKSFGAVVYKDRSADISVFNGKTEVFTFPCTKTHSAGQEDSSGMIMEQRIPLYSGDFIKISPSGEFVDSRKEISAPVRPRSKIIRLSTAGETGMETTIHPILPPEARSNFPVSSEIYLLLKNSPFKNGLWSRKVYFSIPLPDLYDRVIQDCQLQLSFGDTGIGFVSRLPDIAHFSVYGLLSSAVKKGSPVDLTWKNAPANRESGNGVDPDQTVLLGTFSIEKNDPFGIRSISGESLKRFIREQAPGSGTFIVVRDTPESICEEHVHGIASSRHPELPPPTLRLDLVPDSINDTERK